jgi:hypothetical protein
MTKPQRLEKSKSNPEVGTQGRFFPHKKILVSPFLSMGKRRTRLKVVLCHSACMNCVTDSKHKISTSVYLGVRIRI